MPKVYNKHHKDAPKGAVYVGRPTIYGNPFNIGPDGTREEVIRKYHEWLLTDGAAPNEAEIARLRGKNLVCWCAPKPCHADILLEMANTEISQIIGG